MRRVLTAFVVYAALVASFGAFGQVSPFTRVEFEDDGRVMVTLDGERVELVSIGGVGVGDLVAGSKHAFEERWQKRIGEDLLDVFDAMEIKLDRVDVIDIEVRRDGAVARVDEAAMTRANREQVWEHNKEAERLAQLEDTDNLLALLAETIRDRHAYATLRGIDFDAMVESLGESETLNDVRQSMQRIVCATGDGHASVEDWRDAFPRGRMPFLLVGVRGGVVAIENDRSALIDPEHPFVDSIDGVPLADWIEAASEYVQAGSPQLVQERSLRLIRYVNFVRAELGIASSSEVSLVLRSQAGERVDIERRVLPIRGLYGTWPWTTSRTIDGDIGYFRLPRMSPEFNGLPSEIWRQQLRDELALVTRGATGLVIDVRGNGGGRRDPIFALMPSLMEAGSDPIVVNTARARIDAFDDPADPEGFLANRYLYPEAWRGWSDAEREAIAEFREQFRPEWETPDAGFSAWHYMVVSPGGDEVSRFDGPVVVLMDENCFSATDIFLGAMGELRNVTLVGTPSAGGSARSRKYEIGPIEVSLASMASYQPNGRLYDGVGVQPDVLVEKRPGDLVLGGGDAQLEHAVEILRAAGE